MVLCCFSSLSRLNNRYNVVLKSFRFEIIAKRRPRMSLEEFMKIVVPPGFSLSRNAIATLSNSLKDKSLIANFVFACDPETMNLVEEHGQLYSYGLKCAICKVVPSDPIPDLFEFQLLLQSDLPTVPCPSCHQTCPLYFTMRYLCSKCEVRGHNPYVMKIVCGTCKVDDLTDAKKPGSRYFTPEDYLRHGKVEREFVNSANKLFQMDTKNLKLLRDENLKMVARMMVNHKDSMRKDVSTQSDDSVLI